VDVLNAVNSIKYLIIFAILLWNAVHDIKYKTIIPSSLVAGSIVSVLFLLIQKDGSIFYHISGMLAGIFLIICSYVTKEQIGIGDGLVFCFTGILLGPGRNIYLLFMALVFSAMISFLMIAAKKAGKKTRIPFVPFVAAAYPLICIIC